MPRLRRWVSLQVIVFRGFRLHEGYFIFGIGSNHNESQHKVPPTRALVTTRARLTNVGLTDESCEAGDAPSPLQ